MAHKPIALLFVFVAQSMLAQTITVNDTDFSKGKLGNIQTLGLNDLSKFHGHLCDGLVEGFIALKIGLKQLYPDGIVDRTNTRIVSKSSPCYTDVAIYLSGGRSQYNTFYVDNTIEGIYIVQRIDNLKTLSIKRKANVKPAIIDELGNKAIKGELSACELEKLKQLEVEYSTFLVNKNVDEIFSVDVLDDFEWQPKTETYIKTDIINKNKNQCDR